MAQNQPNLNQSRQDIMDIAAMTEETFRSVASNIQDMFANALNSSDTVVKSFQKDISNSIKSAARESSKLADNFERIGRGALKQADIQKQLEARAAKLRSIEVSIAAFKKIGTAEAIAQANELNQQYQDLVSINESYTEELNKQIKLLDKVDQNLNKQLGLTPQILGGLDTSLKKLGLPDLGFKKALEDTKQIAIQNEQNGKKTNIWATYTKSLGSNFKEVLSFSNLIQVSIGFIIDAFLTLDSLTGQTAKNLGISYNQSAKLSSEFNSIANSSDNLFVTTKGINESFNQINQALGTNGQISKELLITQTELVKQAGYSVEAATAISKLSLATGKPAKEITTQFLGQAKALNLTNKTAINEKQLLESISKASKSILLTFASQPGKLAEAAYETKKLGLELDQIQGIQDSLLNIESSIASEFEAEVLTGKQLNLERARYYALTNNIAGLAKELSAQGITQDKFSKMNVIQQEAVAKAMGMSKDQMAGMLMEQTAISKLSALDGNTAKEKYDNAVKKYGVEKANKMLGDETLAQQMQSASTQEKFLASLEKVKEIFVTLVDPLLPVLNTLADMSGVITTIIGSMLVYKGIQLTMLGIQKAQATWEAIKLGYTTAQRGAALGYNGILLARQAIMSGELAKAVGIAAAYAIANPFTALAGLAVAAGVGAVVYSQMKDGVIDPKKGPVVSGEFGTVQLNPRDSIVAGTNLMPETKVKSAPTAQIQSSPSIDYDKMAQAMSRVKVQTNLDGVRVSSELQKAPMGIATRKI